MARGSYFCYVQAILTGPICVLGDLKGCRGEQMRGPNPKQVLCVNVGVRGQGPGAVGQGKEV